MNVVTFDPRDLNIHVDPTEPIQDSLVFSVMPLDVQGNPVGVTVINGKLHATYPDNLPAMVVYKDGNVEIRSNYDVETVKNARYLISGTPVLINGEIPDSLPKKDPEDKKVAFGVCPYERQIYAVFNYSDTRSLGYIFKALNCSNAILVATGTHSYVRDMKGEIVMGNFQPKTVASVSDFSALARPIIVIDPGHGGADPGGQGNGSNEKDFNLRGAMILGQFLADNYICTPLFTRINDTFVSLNEINRLSDACNADYFVSLHVNASGGEGYEDYVCRTAGSRTRSIRDIIHKTMCAYLAPFGVGDRGALEANFQVITYNKAPSILIENLFIDNVKDIALLRNDGYFTGFYQTLGRAIAQALPLKRKPMQVNPPPASPPYKVLVGSYPYRADADDMQKKLKGYGIDSTIIQ